jgi:hypothetical protein
LPIRVYDRRGATPWQDFGQQTDTIVCYDIYHAKKNNQSLFMSYHQDDF